MNELIFFLHLAIVLGFLYTSFKLGKEALIVWIAIQGVLANLFVIKQMHFFGFNVTCSDVFAIGSILGLNLLQRHFGKEVAKKTTWISFFFMSFFALMS